MNSDFGVRKREYPKYWFDGGVEYRPLTGLYIRPKSKKVFLEASDLREIDRNLKIYFNLLGFKKDITTSYDHTNDKMFMGEIQSGYKKGDIMCMTQIEVHASPYGSIFCGVVDKEQMSLMDNVSPVFTKYTSPRFPNEAHVITIKSVDGMFASGYRNFYRDGQYLPSGTFWIAIQEDDKWPVIFESQESPTCQFLEKNSIPKTVVEYCYDSSYDLVER